MKCQIKVVSADYTCLFRINGLHNLQCASAVVRVRPNQGHNLTQCFSDLADGCLPGTWCEPISSTTYYCTSRDVDAAVAMSVRNWSIRRPSRGLFARVSFSLIPASIATVMISRTTLLQHPSTNFFSCFNFSCQERLQLSYRTGLERNDTNLKLL